MPNHIPLVDKCRLNLTSLGAIRYDRVMDFSGGISALVLPMMRRQSPEVTAFTLPLSHPEAPGFAAMIAAIFAIERKQNFISCEAKFS